jgi:predicted MPP superfamily phosphohydrolase
MPKAGTGECRNPGKSPDLVLFGGDIFDEDFSGEIERKTAVILGELKVPFGIYAVTGNHEYYAGLNNAVANLKQAEIPYLQDSVVRIADAFYLIGRKDLTAERLGDSRKALDDLLAGVDKSLPLSAYGPSAVLS